MVCGQNGHTLFTKGMVMEIDFANTPLLSSAIKKSNFIAKGLLSSQKFSTIEIRPDKMSGGPVQEVILGKKLHRWCGLNEQRREISGT